LSGSARGVSLGASPRNESMARFMAYCSTK
jgi:hypothetical protein